MLWRRIWCRTMEYRGGGWLLLSVNRPEVMIVKSHRRTTKVMGNETGYLEFLKYREGKKEMSDVALAKDLIRDIGGPGKVATVLFNAYTALSNMFPHREDPENQWSARRLRAWWNNETGNVLHREMRELYQAAQVKKAEQELIREARNEHKQFLAKTAAIAALLERQDETFHSATLEAMGEQLGRMGRPRNQGD